MKYSLNVLALLLTMQFAYSQKIDLSAKWDTVRPLANPEKGWYHHMLDNGIGKYLLKDESELKAFPGMDHLYLRLAWAYLEPEEGKFNWSYIDNIVEKAGHNLKNKSTNFRKGSI